MLSPGNGGERRNDSFECHVDTTTDRPTIAVVEVVGILEDSNVGDLSPLYDRIGHLVEELLSDSVTAESRAKLEFLYEGYRITLRADGHATFVKLSQEQD